MNAPPYSAPSYQTAAPAYTSAPSGPLYQQEVQGKTAPAAPYQVAYSNAPSVPPYAHTPYPGVALEPTYTRRCGYWLWWVVVILSFFQLFGSIEVALSSNYQLRNLYNVYHYTGFKVFCMCFAVVSLFISYKALADKKFSTEPGNFKIAYSLFLLQFFFLFGQNAFQMADFLGTLVVSLVLASIAALGPAAILTMDEGYEGCLACLKCLKPWAVERLLPMSQFKPPFAAAQYPIRGYPVQSMPQAQFVPQYSAPPQNGVRI